MAKKAKSLFDQFATDPNAQRRKILKPAPKAKVPKPNAQPKTPKVPGSGAGPSATSVAPKLVGQYDPVLDAQFRASQRGLTHLREDTATAGGRESQDLMQTLSLAGRNQTRANEDFDSQLQGLFRQYGLQGQQQSQAANAAGVLHGGTQAASAQVRAGNLAFARAPIDVGRARTAEDYTTATGEAQQAYDRAGQDRGTKLQRAIAEAAYYGSDLSNEAVYQAAQNNPDLLSMLSGKGGPSPSGKKGKQPPKQAKPKAGQPAAQGQFSGPKKKGRR